MERMTTETTRVVGVTLPADLLGVLDRAIGKRPMATRASYVRDALYDRMRREGLIRVSRDSDGSIYEMAISEVMA